MFYLVKVSFVDSPGILGLVPVASWLGQNTYNVRDLATLTFIGFHRLVSNLLFNKSAIVAVALSFLTVLLRKTI